MEQISKNFNVKEFEKSATAAKYDIDNTLPAKHRPALYALVKELLQPLIDYIRFHGIDGFSASDIVRVICVISSGYRCPALNQKVGGVSSSQHVIAEAADTKIRLEITDGRIVNVPAYEVKEALIASKLKFDQAILYNSFLHLSYHNGERANRMQVLYNRSYTGKR